MATNTSVSITTSSISVLTSSFRTCVLTNNGTEGIIWLRIGESGNAVVGEGVGLSPGTATTVGGTFSINDSSLYQSPITAISSAGTNSLAVYYV